ncbi:MAG: hypothetical protein D6675_00025, partial [Gemmatimonadetes bacterium]
DEDLFLFHQLFLFLGLPTSTLPVTLKIAYENSLFSGQTSSKHIRSGKTNQWKTYFQHVHKQRFLALFDDVLIQLGYETNHDWLAV